MLENSDQTPSGPTEGSTIDHGAADGGSRYLAALLVKCRIDRRLTATAAADRLKLSKSMLCNYEKGRNLPPWDTCLRLVEFYDIDVQAMRFFLALGKPAKPINVRLSEQRQEESYAHDGTLARRLKLERARRKLTGRAVSAQLCIDPNCLSRFEAGKRHVNAKMLQAFANFYKIDVEELKRLPQRANDPEYNAKLQKPGIPFVAISEAERAAARPFMEMGLGQMAMAKALSVSKHRAGHIIDYLILGYRIEGRNPTDDEKAKRKAYRLKHGRLRKQMEVRQAQAVNLFKSGYSQAAIAEKTGSSITTVFRDLLRHKFGRDIHALHELSPAEQEEWDHWQETHQKAEVRSERKALGRMVADLLRMRYSYEQIGERLGKHVTIVLRATRSAILGRKWGDESAHTPQEQAILDSIASDAKSRHEKELASLAGDLNALGYSSKKIAKHCGVGENTIRRVCSAHSVALLTGRRRQQPLPDATNVRITDYRARWGHISVRRLEHNSDAGRRIAKQMGLDPQIYNDGERLKLLRGRCHNFVSRFPGKALPFEPRDFIEQFYADPQFIEVYDAYLKMRDTASVEHYRPAVDHKLPVSRGGSNELDNLQWLTYGENDAKGAMTDDEWLAHCKNENVFADYYLHANAAVRATAAVPISIRQRKRRLRLGSRADKQLSIF